MNGPALASVCLDRRRLVERAVRGDAVLGAGAERVLVQQHGDGAGVARLDREDRARGAQERLALQAAGLAEVGADADVLEDERGREELVPDVRAAKSKVGLATTLPLSERSAVLSALTCDFSSAASRRAASRDGPDRPPSRTASS